MRKLLAVGLVLLALLGHSRPLGAAEQRSTFDHRTTGFELLGRHRDVPCEACHVNAVFRGTPRDCVACHGAGTAVRATAKPTSHIITTDRCEACHTPVAWVPAVNFDHAQALGSCSSCHNNVQAPGKSAQHIATALECNACHDTLGWAGAKFDHAGITSGCASCHNGAQAVGMPPNHIPTAGAPCEDCHSTTEFTTFDGAVMDHAAVASIPCSTCHEAGMSFAGTPVVTTRPPAPHPATGECSGCHTTANWNATDLPANHIPLPAADANDCALCHSNESDFSVYVMNHVNISSNCAGCHGPGLAFANMAPPTLKEPPANHIPTGGAPCEDCHAPTQFTSFDGSTMDHAVVASTPCSTCHEAGMSFAGTPLVETRPPAPHPATGECSNCHTTANWNATDLPANHIPLPAADAGNCSLCHTNPSDYSVYVMNHVNITGNCAQCHGAGLAFANMAPPTLKEPPLGPPAHVPIGTLACELCHVATNFTSFAGTVMRHAAVTGQACDSCHELGMAWYGEPNLWVRPSANHHAGQDCGNSGCHRPQDKRLLALPRVAAARATAQPASAAPGPRTAAAGAAAPSGGAARPGLAAGMVLPRRRVTGAMPLGPSSRLVDHSQLTGACVSCHDGRSAVGVPPGHLGNSARCDACHTTNAWLPARFDHLAMSARACASCHDGVRAIGMPRDHVRTVQSCDTCHGTLGWTPVRVDHSGFVSGCSTCHNNVSAVGMTLTHFRTRRDCSVCHRYPDWGAVTFRHAAAGYPGAHHAGLPCAACHTTNTELVTYPSPAAAGRCGGCHARDFKPAAHPLTVRGLLYGADQLADCTGACHVYSDATRTKIVRSLPGPQHRVGDAAF
jgi:Cytochrome c7 and related cytochrome c